MYRCRAALFIFQSWRNTFLPIIWGNGMCEARWNGVRQLLFFFFGCAKGADSPICSLFSSAHRSERSWWSNLHFTLLPDRVVKKPSFYTYWPGCRLQREASLLLSFLLVLTLFVFVYYSLILFFFPHAFESAFCSLCSLFTYFYLCSIRL